MSRADREQDLERIVPDRLASGSELDRQILRLHLDRYQWAAEVAEGKRVLDVACGVGYGARLLRDAGASEVLGLDISPVAIELANRTYGGQGVRFAVGDAEAAGSEADFDLVVSLETLEHLTSPESAVLHFRSLLKPSGMAVLSVPVTFSTDFNPNHLHDFTRRGFMQLLASCGLQPVSALLQVHRFQPLAVFRARSDPTGRIGSGRRLLRHYAVHPADVVRRATTILRHGFANKYLVVRAVLAHDVVGRSQDVGWEVREYG